MIQKEISMIKKEIRKRLESGQNWMKGLNYLLNSFILANIILKVKKWAFGQKWIQRRMKKQENRDMMIDRLNN
ncbi:unnamed protein product [Paramecium sonneborni]|uniref:Uncharacterized protein n=1 Tax=Paramecium sonneborni TaxID=65129 RepID=A0A8S1RN88_9CILI|nr:unnamed protein product [Paramecium sonneborni]